MGMAGYYDMPVTDMTVVAGGSSLNWLLIGVIAGSVILGIIAGILLGRKAMKKRDI